MAAVGAAHIMLDHLGYVEASDQLEKENKCNKEDGFNACRKNGF